MIRSMTGYGRGEARVDGKEFLVEMKAVNHRYCDVFIKIYKQVSFLEDRVRELVNKSFSRGKIDVFITFEDYSDDSKNVLLDENLAQTYIKAAELLKDKYGLKDDITVSLISRFPDVLRVEKPEADEEKLWNVLKTALEAAVSNLISMRENEGEELKRCIEERLDQIEGYVEKIKERSPLVVKEYKAKLETRIKELLEHQTIDDNRLNVEVALFADRCSIDEELVRLGSHIIQTRQALKSSQPVGRKLDFMLQEMNREVNTIGSKANDLEIVKDVVELKSELEKIREQIQNIE
jgi:uncharacterized protein (TIGR00255 family)